MEIEKTWDRSKKPVSANLPDKYDRIRDAILHDRELDDPDERRLRHLAVAIWPIMIDEVTTTGVCKKMVELGLAKDLRAATKLIPDVERIYGRVKQADKDGRRAIMVEILLDALKRARDKGNFNAVQRIADRIAKLEGLYMEEGSMVNIYNELTLPAPMLTDDPKVIEETPFVEIDE